MKNIYNSPKGASDIGILASPILSRVNRVGRSDRDDFYRFQLGNRSRFDLKLSQIAKGTNIDVELYALKRPWNQVVRQISKSDFRKLPIAIRNASLQWINTSKQARNQTEKIIGDLASGEYCIRVLQRSGDSRYRLSLQAGAIDPTTPTVNPPTNSKPTLPSRPPSSGNGYSVTGTDETNIRAQFDLFSTTPDNRLIQDEAATNPTVGLFTGAVENFVSGRGRLRGINSSEIVTPFTPDSSESGAKFATLNLRADLVYDPVQQKGTLEYKIFPNEPKSFKPGIDPVVFGVKFNLDSDFSQSFDLDRSVNSLDYIIKNNLLGDNLDTRNGKSSGIGFSDYPILRSDSSASGVEGGTVLTSKSTTTL